MKNLLITIFVILSSTVYSQEQDNLTATQIMDSSIEFSGGSQRISRLKTTELSYRFISSDTSVIAIAEKRECGKTFTQSILSKEGSPQTTFFNEKKLTEINGATISHFEDIKQIEEMKLKTFGILQYGYKKLNFKLDRLPDKKFENFDCYVIEATAKNSYSTINFFDKSNFRLLMVVYPNGDKSLMIDYIFKDSILFNSHIINTNSNGEIKNKLILLDVKTNTNISKSWFSCPYKDTVVIPDFIKTGKFEPINDNSVLERTEKNQTETYNQGANVINLHLKWVNDDTYMLILKEPIEGLSIKNEIFVKIVSWDKNGYVCHYMAGQACGTQEYKIIK